MDYTDYSAIDPTTQVDPMFMTAYWGFVAVFSILMLVAFWKIFVKAGKPGWASLIPIYNSIVLLQIAGYSGWYILVFFIPFINIIFAFMVYHKLSQAFGHGIGFTLGLIFLSPIFFLILAFDSSTYTDPKGAGKPAKPDDKKPADPTPAAATPTKPAEPATPPAKPAA